MMTVETREETRILVVARRTIKVTEKQRRSPEQSRSKLTCDAILTAAAQVLERGGDAAFTTNRIAERAGVADATGWCPIDPLSFESRLQSDIHVIGDATIAAPMPKSAFSANLQAKVCAFAIARTLSDLSPEPTVLANTCYSYTTPDEAISIAGVYSNADGQLQSIGGAGGISPLPPDKSVRAAEAAQAAPLFATITAAACG